jgi:D-glycero-beta-D-manno-heptose 1-phosphate adenylyltransferase
MQTAGKILDRSQLDEVVKDWKKNGQKIVFTNGCFDILHLGHVDYLEKAAGYGDRLVLGLNADSSVRRLKGDDRPLNNQYARARVLAALHFVDAVVVFEEDTPYELIKQVVPHVLVKGSDYTVDNIVGADVVLGNGGQVATIDFVEGYSTTKIVNKIKHN